MTLKTLRESGMDFFCDSRDTFFVEKHVKESGIQHVKTVEFIRQKNQNMILLVEAKTSAPKPSENDPVNFEKFINEITQKAIDGFSILLTAIISRRQAELGELIASADYTKTCFCLVLVIKNHKKAWLSPIQDILRDTLRHFYTAWNWGNQPILVLNEEMARDHKFIMSFQGESGSLDLDTMADSKTSLKDSVVSTSARQDRRKVQSLTSLPPRVGAHLKHHKLKLLPRSGAWRVKAQRRQ